MTDNTLLHELRDASGDGKLDSELSQRLIFASLEAILLNQAKIEEEDKQYRVELKEEIADSTKQVNKKIDLLSDRVLIIERSLGYRLAKYLQENPKIFFLTVGISFVLMNIWFVSGVRTFFLRGLASFGILPMEAVEFLLSSGG